MRDAALKTATDDLVKLGQSTAPNPSWIETIGAGDPPEELEGIFSDLPHHAFVIRSPVMDSPAWLATSIGPA